MGVYQNALQILIQRKPFVRHLTVLQRARPEDYRGHLADVAEQSGVVSRGGAVYYRSFSGAPGHGGLETIQKGVVLLHFEGPSLLIDGDLRRMFPEPGIPLGPEL